MLFPDSALGNPAIFPDSSLKTRGFPNPSCGGCGFFIIVSGHPNIPANHVQYYFRYKKAYLKVTSEIVGYGVAVLGNVVPKALNIHLQQADFSSYKMTPKCRFRPLDSIRPDN